MATFVILEDACQAILDYIKSKDFDRAIAKEDQAAFMSGLGMAGVIMQARCDKYMIDLSQFDIHTDFSDFKVAGQSFQELTKTTGGEEPT